MVKKKPTSNNKESNRKKFLSFKYRLPKRIKKSHKINNSIYDNPRITSIKAGSKFIYDLNTFEIYFSQVKNKNNLKLKLSELDYLKDKINEINIEYGIDSSKYITIPKETFKKIEKFTPKLAKEDDATIYIKNLIQSQKEKGFMSCRRIANKFFEDTGKKISKTKVNNILRNKLNLRFLKTTIKNDKINNNRNILMSLCFIKILIKCIQLNYRLIYIDESIIQSNNNNFKSWRSKEEGICFKLSSNKRKNLIAAVDHDSILYYKINDENTDENKFLSFMKEIKNIIDEKNIKDYVIIMDNLSCHKTPLLKTFYLKNNINIIFNSPYQSSFNLIEFFFRLVKRKIYKNLYSSTEEAAKDIEKIIQNENLKDSLYKNYRETL